jgi:menaquinone-dependent protoporphyrinogen IX oxidase
MTLNQNAGAAQRSKPSTVAERIVQALREAGYSCELADEAYSRNDVDLRTRH